MRIEMSRYECIQKMSVRELAELIVRTQLEGIRVGLQMAGVEFDPTTINTEEAINEMVDKLLEVETEEIKIGEENGNS